MTESDSEKVSLKFWISSLAFCMLLMAATFAVLASYLAEIKSNTAAALARADIVSQHLNTLDSEVSAIHHHILAEKFAASSSTSAPVPAQQAEAPAAPAAVEPTPVPVQPPAAPAAVAPTAVPAKQP